MLPQIKDKEKKKAGSPLIGGHRAILHYHIHFTSKIQTKQ